MNDKTKSNDEVEQADTKAPLVERLVMWLRPSQFVAGCICTACAISLIQDWYGLEGYIAHLQKYWTDGAYTVPMAIVIWLLTIVLMRDK